MYSRFSSERIQIMIEATTNPAARSIMQNAHAERAAAVQGVWAWLLGKTFR